MNINILIKAINILIFRYITNKNQNIISSLSYNDLSYQKRTIKVVVIRCFNCVYIILICIFSQLLFQRLKNMQ